MRALQTCPDCGDRFDQEENCDCESEVDSAAPCSPPDWERVQFRTLQRGEIIAVGDWCDVCADGWRDEPKWKQVERGGNSAGMKAPDPSCVSHQKYRRVLEEND